VGGGISVYGYGVFCMSEWLASTPGHDEGVSQASSASSRTGLLGGTCGRSRRSVTGL
jgi:hypothetical protein